MSRPQRSAARLARGGADAALVLLSFCAAYVVRFEWLPAYTRPESLAAHFETNGWLPLLAVPAWWLLLYVQGGYAPLRSALPWTWAGRVFRAGAMVALLLGAAVFLGKVEDFSRGFFVAFVGLSAASLSLFRAVGRASLPLVVGPGEVAVRRVLVVGTGEEARLYDRALAAPERGARVVGFLDPSGNVPPAVPAGRVLGTLDDLDGIVEREGVDEVAFAVPFRQLDGIQEHLARCEEVGAEVRVVADFLGLSLSSVHVESVGGLPMLSFVPTPSWRLQFFLKRVLDVVLAATMLAALSPVMLAVAVGVRLTSPGPVLFRQTRCGLRGRPFQFLKFRSMYQDAEARRSALEPRNELRGPVFKIRDDPRITPFGRFIRRRSLDELPQLLNVLRGEMSLVGPRPPLPHEVLRYERWQRRRLSMCPGLTCIWQVSGRNEVPFERWMEMDLRYIDEWSLWLDVKILLLTVPAVLSARGAS